MAATVELREEESYSFDCKVKGGFPEVKDSDITLDCGENVNVTGGQTKMTLSHNGTKCTCKADHPSKCYTLETEVTVIIICEYHSFESIIDFYLITRISICIVYLQVFVWVLVFRSIIYFIVIECDMLIDIH